MPAKNQVVSLAITDLTNEGNGVGRAEGMAVFVPGTAPGDVITAKLVKVRRRYAYGILEELVTPSPHRVENDCPVFARCGGCAFRHLSYAAELEAKARWTARNMEQIGGVAVPPEPILPSPVTGRYRNKAQYPVRLVNGRVQAGFFAPRSHRLIPVEDCKLQPAHFGALCRAVCDFAGEKGIPPYEEEGHTGLLRHIFLRHGESSGQTLVCLVLNGPSLPGEAELAARLAAIHPGTSLCVSANTRRTNVILGESVRPVSGTGRVADKLAGVALSLSPLSFFQVNRGAAELLYQTALEYADPTGLVLDLYCGAGAIGLSMAARAARVLGVETAPQAVEDARANAAANGIVNAQFLCGDAPRAAARLCREGTRPQVVVVDPPRKGVEAEGLAQIAAMAPERIVYVSCNSATLARDCALLAERGYRVSRWRPVDLFPRTGHVEAVCLLTPTC